jgi:hypothetical protein
MYVGTEGTVECFEGIIFSRTPKMLAGLVKKILGNHQNYSISITVRPLYVPQLGHAWCGSLASPHWGQLVRFGPVIF